MTLSCVALFWVITTACSALLIRALGVIAQAVVNSATDARHGPAASPNVG